jgi:hypothetical protein
MELIKKNNPFQPSNNAFPGSIQNDTEYHKHFHFITLSFIY